MRTRTALYVLIMASLLLGACGPKTFTTTPKEHTVIPFAQLVPRHKALESLLKSGKTVIISVKKGQKLPMTLELDTNIVTSKAQQELVVKQDLCVLISKGRVALSPDCRRFAWMHDGKSVWKLFKMGKGSTSVGLKVDKKGLMMPVRIRAK